MEDIAEDIDFGLSDGEDGVAERSEGKLYM